MSYERSVNNWLTLLSDGDEAAIETAFDRYFTRLTRLATSKMTGLNQAARSGEDLALSAFRSFCSGIKARRLVVTDDGDLWACLFRIATRKVCAERRRAFAAKRGGRCARVDSVWKSNGDDEGDDVLSTVAGREPSPELALEMAQRADEILQIFGDNPKRRQIVELKLLGLDDAEIAEQTGLSKRTVCWHLSKIRDRLEFATSAELFFDELFAGTPLEAASERAGWAPEAARRVVELSVALWRKGTGDDKLPSFLSELGALEAPRAARRDSGDFDGIGRGRILEVWKRMVRNLWLERLLKEYSNASEEKSEGRGR